MDAAPPSPVIASVGAGACRFEAARRRHGFLLAAIIGAVVLLALGIGGRDVMRYTSDLPGLPELAADGATVYGPKSPQSVVAILVADHAPALRAAKLATVAVNGEIDARIPVLIAVVLGVFGIGVVLAVIGRAVRTADIARVAFAGGLVLLMPAVTGLLPLATFGVGTWCVALCALQLLLMTGCEPLRRGWWVGVGCGLAALCGASAGIASTVALVLWYGAAEGRRRRPYHGLVASMLVLIVGGVLVALRATNAPVAIDFRGIGALARWPFQHTWSAPLMWWPALAYVVVGLGGSRRPAPALWALAAWSLIQVVILGLFGATRHDTALFLCVAVMINTACCLALPAGSESARTLRLVLTAGWAILVGAALLPASTLQPLDPDVAHAQAIALAKRIREHDAIATEAMPGAAADREAAGKIARNESLQSILPASVRGALTLGSDPSAVFRANAAPALAERESLPVLGTWSADGANRTGEFVSKPLTTRFPVVQVRIGGELRPPASSIMLRRDDGVDIRPLSNRLVANARWRRLNFPAPRGPFRIVATATQADPWLAFTAPVEIGALTRVLAKLPPNWPTVPWGCGIAVALTMGMVLLMRAVRKARSDLPAAGWATAGAVAQDGDSVQRGPASATGTSRSSTGSGVPTRPFPWRVVPWIALFAYAVFFSYHLDPTAGPNDSGGYLNSAKLMVSGHVAAEARTLFGTADTDITRYLPITFHEHNGRMVPEYPVGWPLEVAILGKILGLARAVPTLIVLQLVLGVVVTQRLARVLGLPEGWSWLAAAIVGLSPVYLFEALQPVSDGPALVWVGAAVYWAWLGRERPRYALLAGAATALAVMIRPANLLCIAPILICLGSRWRALALWIVGGIPGAVWLAWYQHALYGSALTTGYGEVASDFALHFIPLTLHSYAIWLPELLTPVVVLAPALPFASSISPRVRLLLFTWAGVFIALYACWWCTWDNWYNMRFILPAFPALIIAALLVAHRLAGRCHLPLFAISASTRMRVASACVVLALAGFLAMRTTQRRVTFWMESNHKPGAAAVWAAGHLPSNAVVFAKHMTGSLFYYTKLPFIRLDHPSAQSAELYRAIAHNGRPVYAVTYHWETREFDPKRQRGTGYPDLPGTWQRIAELGDGDITVWRRE